MVDSGRVPVDAEAVPGALLAVPDPDTAELSADALDAGELVADSAGLLAGAALDATAGADELALEAAADDEIADDDIADDDIADDEGAAEVAAIDVVAVVEEPDAAGVELPHADRPRTQAIRRAVVDFPVLFTVQTVAAAISTRG